MRTITRDKEGHFMIKRSIYQEHRTITKVYKPQNTWRESHRAERSRSFNYS